MSETSDLLTAILDTLREIRAELRASGGSSSGAGQASGKGGLVAGDRELDSEWGNPSVRKDPRGWKGDSFVGCKFSECPPEYLDDLAGLFDWMGDKDEQSGNLHKGKPTAPYKRRDAARARGWAKRLRDGWTPSAAPQDDAPPADDFGGVSDNDIPF